MSGKSKKYKVEIEEGFPEFGENFGLILHPEPLGCPQCGSVDFQHIAYGLPGPELLEEEAEGKIKLGGCVETIGQSPRWFCTVCHHAWR